MSSTEASNNKRTRASSQREESTAIIRRRTIVSITFTGFESLVDDTHDTILQFLGKRSYGSYGSINKRCREIFLSKNLPKETFLYGYAPLSMIKEKLNMYNYRVGQAVVAYNRNDILHWLVQEKDKWSIISAFNIAAGVSLDTLKRVKNDFGDDAFTTMKVNEDWDVSYEAAWSGKLDVLKWLKTKGWFDPNRIRIGMNTVALKGNIPVLEWLVENGCELYDDVFRAAAEGGHVNMLKFLKEKNCPLDPEECMLHASVGGSMESIQWLLQNGCSFEDVDSFTIERTARQGHLHVIKFFVENGYSIDDISNDASHFAAGGGHLHVLEWLHENNCPFDEETFANAARNGNIENLQWLLEIHCPFDKWTFAKAARNGNIDNLQWLLENNFPWDNYCYSEAAELDKLEVLEWLKEKGCLKGDSVLVVDDYDYVSSEVKDWLRENGFTLEEKDDNSSYDY